MTYRLLLLRFVDTVFQGIGICACCVPAWRAMRVEPVVALRQE